MDLPSPGEKAKKLLFPNCEIIVDNLTKSLAIVKDNDRYYLTCTKNELRSGTKVYMEFTISINQLMQKKSLLSSQLGSAWKTKNIIWTVFMTLLMFLIAQMFTYSIWTSLICAALVAITTVQSRGISLGKKKAISIFMMALAGTDLNIIRM